VVPILKSGGWGHLCHVYMSEQRFWLEAEVGVFRGVGVGGGVGCTYATYMIELRFWLEAEVGFFFLGGGLGGWVGCTYATYMIELRFWLEAEVGDASALSRSDANSTFMKTL
jgi:hypothetical protein